MHDAETFLAWLKTAAEAKGMSQADIARAMDVPPSTVNRWFQGSLPHRRTMQELREVMESSRVRDAAPPQKTDGEMVEEILTEASGEVLADLLDRYLSRAAEPKAKFMARLVLSEINRRAAIAAKS
jgi:transcriptional regulator with XRE-family HTH domain